jgi:acyl-CoA thioesterase FadM
MTADTPSPRMVTPYSASPTSMVRFWWVITSSWLFSRSSSVIYRVGLFQGDGDEAAAEGRFVHVYVDNTRGAGDRPVRPLPDAVRAAVEPLLR